MSWRSIVAVAGVALWLGCGSASDSGSGNGIGDIEIQGECSLPDDCAEGLVCVDQACVPATCTDLQLNGNETDIDCGGDCSPCTEGQACLGFIDCESQFCRTDDRVCRDCSSDSDCEGAPGTHCSSGRCAPLKEQAESCSDGSECVTGWCVDGVCCDGPCDGTCQTCGGGDGVCRLIEAGGDSQGDCPDEDGCGLDGTCDGAGGCRLSPSGATCMVAGCAGGPSGSGTCDGAGICNAASGGCVTYACSAGNTCFTTCTDDEQCAAGRYCSSGDCLPRKANGQTCSGNDDECSSGHCVDGVCCNSSCGSSCHSCKGSKTGGSNGTCAPITAGTDPDNECPTDPASSCGRTGMCGDAGCQLYGSNTQCAAATCSNGVAYSARFCDGNSNCAAATTDSCFPYLCNGTSCYTSCSSGVECRSTYYCNDGTCKRQPIDTCLKATGDETPLVYACP